MTTVMYQTPQIVRQPVIITAPPAGGSSPFTAEKYMYRAGVGLGITQTVFGVISLIFGIIFTAWAPAVYFYNAYYRSINEKTGAGIWCGILFIATGVLGILTQKKNKGLIISYMIMSIVSAVISWIVLVGISSIDLVHSTWSFYYPNFITGQSGFFIFLSFVEGLVAVISAAICGHAVCCCSKPSSQGTVTYTVPNNGQNAVAYVPPGQQGFVYYPQQGPHVVGYNAQPMYAQGPPAYNTAQQQQQQEWSQQQQQQPHKAQEQHQEEQPKGGATGQEAEVLEQRL